MTDIYISDFRFQNWNMTYDMTYDMTCDMHVMSSTFLFALD